MDILGSIGQLYMFILLILLFLGCGLAVWAIINTTINNKGKFGTTLNNLIEKLKNNKIIGGSNMVNNGFIKLAVFSFIGIIVSAAILTALPSNNMNMQSTTNTNMQGTMNMQGNMNTQGSMNMQNNNSSSVQQQLNQIQQQLNQMQQQINNNSMNSGSMNNMNNNNSNMSNMNSSSSSGSSGSSGSSMMGMM